MDTPVWDAVWSYVVPLSLLLLQCDMRKIGRESRRILIVFLIGSVETTCGALIGFAALHNVIPELSGITGAFTGTYIEGSTNFAALSTAFDVSGEMMSAAVVADNLLMILYFFVLITIPSIGFFGEIKGSQELGTFLIYLFFFVIGAPASVPLIIINSLLLLLFTAIVVAMNMIFSFIGGKIFKFNLEDIICASNANIGRPTTAVAMAISKGWTKLVDPCLLIGTLGYILGTYMGLLVGSILGL